MNNNSEQKLFPKHKALGPKGESLELILFHSQTCGFCHRVMKWAQKLQVPLTVKDARRDRQAKNLLISVGGKRQVPCLFINGRALYESSDIIEFFQSLTINKANS